MILVGSLSLIFLNGCRNKIVVGEICVSLETPGFACANQSIPEGKNGYDKSYRPNMICQEADQYNKLIDQLAQMQSEIAKYKWKNKN